MTYAEWNQKLFEFFFSEDRGGTEVLLLVDAPLLQALSDITTEDGAIDDFVSAISQQDEGDGAGQNVCLKAVNSWTRWNTPNNTAAPPFIAYLALFVLAWTTAGEDEGLQAGAYYNRLHALLRRGNDQSQVNSPQLERTNCLWNSLEDWSLRLDFRLGLFEAHSAGGHINIGFPLSQALFGEKDRLGLERLFADLDLDAERLPEPQRMREILDGIIGHYCNHGAATRFQNDNLKTPMAVAARAILSRWDGEFEEEGNSGRGRAAALALRLTLRQQPGGWVLGGRLLSRSGQFDLDDWSPFICQGQQYQWKSQHAGWSTQWVLPPEFLADNSHVALANGRRVHFARGDIYAFEQNQIVGDCTQTHTVYPAKPYWFLATQGSAALSRLCEVNPGIVTTVANGHTVSKNWQLWRTNGLADTAPLGTLAADTSQWSLLLAGGCRLGRGAEYPVFALPSFVTEGPAGAQAELVVLRNNAVIETKTVRAGERNVVPDEDVDGIVFRAYLRVPQDDTQRLGRPRSFRVIRPSLSEAIASNWASNVADGRGYLYPGEAITIQFVGGICINANRFARLRRDGLPLLRVLPQLEALQVQLDGADLERQGNSFLLPQDVGCGRHFIASTWHGTAVHVRNSSFELVQMPTCEIDFRGGRRVLSVGGTEIRVVSQQEARSAHIFLRPEDSRYRVLVDGFAPEVNKGVVPLASLTLPSNHEITVTWQGVEISRARGRYQPIPNIFGQCQDGEMWPDNGWYKLANPPVIRFEVEDAPEAEIELVCCNIVLEHSGAGIRRFPLEGCDSIMAGVDLPIYARWHELDLGELCRLSMVSQPNASIEVRGGRRDAQGGYRYRSGYSFRVHPWEGFYSRAMRVTRGISGAELPVYANGDVDVGALAVGRHELILHWFDQILVRLPVTFFQPESIVDLVGGARLTEGHDVFLPEHLPAFLVDTDERGIKVTINGNRIIEMPNEPRALVSLDDRLIPRGVEEVTIEAFSGGAKIGNKKRFQIASASWRRLGCVPGEVAGIDDQPAWETRWYAKNAGRAGWEVICSNEYAAAAPEGNYERQKIKDWRKIVREGTLRGGNTEVRAQWRGLGGMLA